MAEVCLTHEQIHREKLPPVCICCGAPAAAYRRRWFIHTPLGNIPFALLGTWRYWRVTLDVPLCAAHRSYFTRRWVPLLAVGLLAVGAAAATYITTDITQGKAQAQALWRILIPAVFGVLVVLYLIGWAVKRRSVRVGAVDRDGLTLVNVSDRFAAAAEGRVSRAPVVLETADDDIPEVMPVGRPVQVRPIAPGPRRLPPPLRAGRRPGRRRWLGVILLAAGAVFVGGVAIILLTGLFHGRQAVRLSNARMTRMGLLLRFNVDHGPARGDPNATYFLVIRTGGNTLVERRLPPSVLATAGNLEAAAAMMPGGSAGPFDGVIELERPGGRREATSNVVRFR